MVRRSRPAANAVLAPGVASVVAAHEANGPGHAGSDGAGRRHAAGVRVTTLARPSTDACRRWRVDAEPDAGGSDIRGACCRSSDLGASPTSNSGSDCRAYDTDEHSGKPPFDVHVDDERRQDGESNGDT